MTGSPVPHQQQEWLMQPAWLPRLRAGIGLAMLLVAVVVLALSWPWRTWALLVIPAWMLLGGFLVWASRFERTGTRLEPDALTVVLGRRPRRLGRADILDVRADPPEQPWRLTAVLRDGEVIPLLGVPPTELERLRRWHVGV